MSCSWTEPKVVSLSRVGVAEGGAGDLSDNATNNASYAS